MKSVALKAYPRSQVQRAEVTKLRAKGLVPATIYGRQAKPQNLEVNYKELTDLLHHSFPENLLVDLSWKPTPAPSASRWCRISSTIRSAAKCCTLIFMKFPRMKKSPSMSRSKPPAKP